MMLKKATRALLDAVYPPLCSLCGELSIGIHPHCCETCFDSFEQIGPSCCMRCGDPFPVRQEAHLCLSCLTSGLPFNWCRGVYLYQGNLSEAISVLKYGKDLSLIRPLQDALVMGACFLDLPLVEAVVPVPISRSVLFGRGFNCAELLAKPLAAHLDVPVIKGAIAKKGKVPQVRLGRSGRINNAAISFSPGRGLKRISGRKVLLVDDVYTTGATAKACTRILRSAGAEVSVLTLARAGKRTVIGVR